MECASGFLSPCASTLAGPASHLFLTLINTLLGSECALEPEGRYPPDYGPMLKDGDEFDFIVVGAGSAGSIVANRLSQVRDWSVLLLEAGTYPSALTEIPAFVRQLQGTLEDWQYVMEPSKTCCLSARGGACHSAKGKVMGGTSALNSMFYVRGNRQDFDEWAARGNEGWDYDSVVQLFRKFENVRSAKDNILNENCWENEQEENPRGFEANGDLYLSPHRSEQPIRGALVNAMKELGYTRYTEVEPLGVHDSLVTIFNGTRISTAKAFIAPLKDRKNLKLALNSHVTRLLIDDPTKTVEGIEVMANNLLLKVRARKEVVLSAGAINSPQILMNSGIGPKEHLETFGIQVVQNLNVGQHLEDHITFPVFVTLDKLATNARLDVLDDIYNYFVHRKGMLSSLDMANFMLFINTKKDCAYPNIQIFPVFFPLQSTSYAIRTFGNGFGLSETLTEKLIVQNKNSSIILFLVALLKPKSIGKILLRSANPFDPPQIFPNFLSDEQHEDMEVLLEAIRFVEKLIATESLEIYNPEIMYQKIKDCEDKEHGEGTDEYYWECAIRHTATHLFHESCTCKMGVKEDPTSVVDPRLRVHNIKGLRVVDASIMPHITSGNTNAPTIMIGEKGAELIKDDWLH